MKFLKKKKIGYICILSLISVRIILNIGLNLILKEMLDAMQNSTEEHFKKLIIFVVFYFAGAVIVTVLSMIFNLYFFKNIGISIRVNLFDNILKKRIEIFNKNRNGDYISLFNNEVVIYENDVLYNSINIFSDILTVLFNAIFMIYINKNLACIMFITVALFLFFISKLSCLTVNPKNNCVLCNRNYNSKIKEYISGFELIKNYSLESFILKKIKTYTYDLEQSKYIYKKITAIFEVVSGYFNLAITLCILIIGGLMNFANAITIGGLVAMIQALNSIITPISDLAVRIVKYKSSVGVAKIIEDESDIKESVKEVKKVIRHDLYFEKQIDIKHLYFSYDDKRNVLDDISCTFLKNKKYVVIGSSGSGKTTLCKLLTHELCNNKGQIEIDGIKISDIDDSYINSIVTIVKQDIFLFNDTIKNNLTLYDTDITDEKIDNIIHITGLTEFIENKGWDFKLEENGRNISGGEKCRIAIARALLKNRNILILDEAFANLDKIIADKIEKDILNMKNITLINITHRISENMLRKYDQVIVMDDGKIKEMGAFSELNNRQNIC